MPFKAYFEQRVCRTKLRTKTPEKSHCLCLKIFLILTFELILLADTIYWDAMFHYSIKKDSLNHECFS